MQLPFSIKANITLEDYFIFSNYYSSRFRTLAISSTIFALVSIAHFYKGMKTGTLLSNIVITLLSGGTFGLLLWYVFYKQKQQYLQNYKQYIDECEDKELTFTEESVFIKTPNTETTAKWSTFSKIEEKDALICFYNNQNQAHIIPKRSFDKQEEVDFFLNWVRLKLKQ